MSHRRLLLCLPAALAAAAIGFAQPPADPKPTPPAATTTAKPAEPTPAEPMDVKSFALASEGEFADLTQLFATLYAKTAPKPAAGQPAKAAPKFTAVARTHTVIVRGTKAELDAADAVVKLLQGGGAATDGKGPQVVKLKAARAEEVVAALAALGLENAAVSLRGSNAVLVLPAADDVRSQVTKVVEAFEKAEAKPSKTGKPVPQND